MLIFSDSYNNIMSPFQKHHGCCSVSDLHPVCRSFGKVSKKHLVWIEITLCYKRTCIKYYNYNIYVTLLHFVSKLNKLNTNVWFHV